MAQRSPLAPSVAPAPAAAASSDADVARTAGRGGIAVAGAKAWFIVAGFVQQTLLPHVIGLAGYGAISSVQAIANIPNNVIVTASIQGVSRAVADAGAAHEEEAFRKALRVHAVLAPLLAVAFLVAAPYVAALEHAPHLVAPLRVFAIIVLVYALYAPLVGALNGKKRFLAQASLDVTTATLRTIGVLAVAWVFARHGEGVLGAAAGLALAAALILPVAVRVAGTGKSGPAGPSPYAHLRVLVPLAAAQLFLNLLMQADISLLRPFTDDAGVAAGLSGELLHTETDKLVGAYRAAQLFAFLPYQLLLSITFILFPMLARARADGDTDAVARYARTGLRLGIVIAGLMVACICGLGPHFLRFAFPKAAADAGGDAIRILALGQGAFAIFGIEANVLGSLGRERWSAAVTAFATACVAALCFALVPGTAFGPALLVRTATATSLALALAALVGAVLVVRTAGSFAPVASLLRVAVALAIAIAVGSRLPWLGRVPFLGEAFAVALVYVAVLVVTRELTKGDVAAVRGALGKRKKG